VSVTVPAHIQSRLTSKKLHYSQVSNDFVKYGQGSQESLFYS
jgi:hypothetical protein